MEQPELTEAQQEAKNEQLAMAVAFEEIKTTRGWEYITAYIQNQVKVFANDALGKGFATMEEYNLRRGEVNGLRKLLGQVDNALQALQDEREKAKTS